ncbi:unnamed protein product [Thlaspi arvense]|uniref:Late embryogenesis abundant protein LEA-2 subgroup domain-containing protein n=1 Tax=Thlaspi arvense TaxID=13288 RepID=A0AAU9S0R8_THLAR|nr:unnamed protein product [Thlaspi arvense]
MKMYQKSDSDMTSLDLSSSSPKPPTYYVQSPSRDSDKSSSAALTHQNTTPTESPSHPSFASRVSNGGFRWKGRRKYHGGRWSPAPDKEEGGDDGEYENLYGDNRGISIATCRLILGVIATLTLFFLISSVLFAASQSFSPTVYVKGVNVHNFYYWEGLDNTGVPTKIMNINCSMQMTTHNPSTFFGIHVSSSAFKLIYSSQFTLAIAQLKSYYQLKQSNHTSRINLVGSKVSLYGAGPDLAASDNNGGVPVKLEFEIRSRANIVGSLVNSRHRKHLSCFFFISSKNTTFVKFTNKTCNE